MNFDILLETLKDRFESNMKRHPDLNWDSVLQKLKVNESKLKSLALMEESGGEPDVIDHNKTSDEYLFCDCSKESPIGRRNLCYDRDALDSRKTFKPKNSAMDVANEMNVEILDEKIYRHLQTLGEFDTKTSSWIMTPEKVRNLGGAFFADRRYDTVFVYHNGAESYYAARGFRGLLRV